MGLGGASAARGRGATHLALIGVLAIVGLMLALQPRPSAEPAGSDSSSEPAVTFTPNAGQTDSSVRYMARGAGHAFYFTPRKAVLDLRRGGRGVALELRFRGANPAPAIVGERRAPGRNNYIVGSERHSNLAIYEQIRYRNLWPGIDMVFRGHGGALKYEFHVAPGADPRDIRLAYAGADSIALAGNGALAIGTPLGTLRDAVPKTVQGGRPVESRYVVSGSGYGFALGAYDRSLALTIDPGLLYGTYLGGAGDDAAEVVDADAAGNAYVSGQTASASFPTTPGAYDPTYGGLVDVYVSKVDGAGDQIYSTYLGGSGDDYFPSLVVGGDGSVYVSGATTSSDFPFTPGAFDTIHDAGDYFVSKLTPDGTDLAYSTSFPAEVAGVALAPDGGLYIGGTVNQPSSLVTSSALDPTIASTEGVLAKLNPFGSAIEWATYIGGEDEDRIRGIATDTAGNVYATGSTRSTEEFPLTVGAYDTTNESHNAFVSKVTPGGTAFSYSTLLGTGIATPNDLEVDSAGHAYVTGLGTVPVTPDAYTITNGTFTTKLNTSGTGLVYSAGIYGNGLAVDASGAAYLVLYADGFGVGGPIPTPGAFDPIRDGTDVLVLKLNPAATGLAYATYFGGSATEIGAGIEALAGGAFIVVGYTNSTDLPTTPGSHDSSFNGAYDGFVAKLQSYDGYPRPKGATPLRLSLVNAYQACVGSGNRIHGPPLGHPSCNPPQPESTNAVPGTGDSNGKPARMDGYMTFRSRLGNPATPADEADVDFEFFVDDLFDLPTLTDYTDQLRILFSVRMTDRNSAGSAMATTQDFLFPLFVDCVPNPDDLEGSACTLDSSAEAIVPGAIKEGKRSIWQIENLRVFDAGADGDAGTLGDNKLFAKPGLFVP